ncbi:maleylpyruvate isomerase N-terminal domain-containing protein [Streptomyces sp. NPDC000941]
MTDTTSLDSADIAVLLDDIRGSATRLSVSLDALTDLKAGEPSTLPGWSRGRVITHLARSADAYRWLLALARTGAEPGPRATNYVTWALDDTIATLAARHFPIARIEATDLDRSWTLAPTGPAATGPGHALLAWLSGRGPATHLVSEPHPPTPPTWPLPPKPGWT